jgi:hypothetical protein
MWTLDEAIRNRNPIIIPMVFLGAIVVYLLMTLDLPDVTSNVGEIAIHAEIAAIREERNLLTITTMPEGKVWRMIVWPRGSRGMLHYELPGRADSVHKNPGSDTVWFLVDKRWQWWKIDTATAY